MANGTLVSAAVYYSDDTKFTGEAGTATNPLCIEDFYDLISNGFTAYINRCALLVEDINMNDYDDYKYNIGCRWVKFYDIDGKDPYTGINHEIRNITTMNKPTSVDGIFIIETTQHATRTVKNINFYNFISYNSSETIFRCGPTSSNIYKLLISNCNFTSYVYKPNGDSQSSSAVCTLFADNRKNDTCSGNETIDVKTITYRNCKFVIKGVLNYTLINEYHRAVFNHCVMEYCHIFLDLKKHFTRLFYYSNINMTYVTGSIEMDGSTTHTLGNYIFDNGGFYTAYNQLSNSYFNIDVSGTVTENCLRLYNDDTERLDVNGPSFVNITKAGTGTFKDPNKEFFFLLTDTECKSITKMEEIKFLVVEGE